MGYFTGQIELLPFFTPEGWLLCNGTEYAISQFTALFQVIGTQFGGNGSTTFKVPNLQGTEPIPKMNYYICYDGDYPVHD